MQLDCWFDGSIGPLNPGGKATWGFVIKHRRETLRTGRGVVGEGPTMTNNVAEVQGVSELLACLLRCYPSVTEAWIRGDSNIVIRAMSGQGKKHPTGYYAPYLAAAKILASQLRSRCKVRFQWVPRENNREADRLADYRSWKGMEVQG